MSVLARLGGLCVILATVTTSALAQTSAPATSPATTPMVDQSTPKAALKTLAIALDAGDRSQVLAVLLASSEPERKLVDAMAELAVVTRQLRDAAIKAFGADQCRALGVDPAANDEALRRIDAATEETDADKATIRPRESDGPPITLVRKESAWRVPVSELTKDVEAADLERNLKDVVRQTKLMRDLAGEIAAGKFKSATDARQELDRRILQSTMPQTESPATAKSQQP